MSRSILARVLAVLAPIVAVATLFLFAGSSHADAQNASLSVSLATWKSTAGTIELCIDLRDAAVGETRQCPQRRLLTFARTGENRWLRSRSIAVAPEVEVWVRARRVGQRLDLGLGVSIEGVRRGLRARSWSLDWPATPVDQWRETSAISLQLPVAPHPELWNAPAGIAVGARRLQMGTAAPEFRLPELGREDGTLRALSSTRSADHRITVIVFWASWAPFVGETLTVLSNLAEREEDVFVLGVNVYEVRAGAGQMFAQEHASNLLHLSDVDGSVARHYRVDGLPELFLLDARGVYRGVVRGAAPLAEILAAVQGIE